MLHLGVAALLIAAFAPRKAGGGQMSPYYKAGGRCMYAPPDAPHYEIPCSDWERELAAWNKGLIGG